jgi:hypothetical protein
MKRTEAMNGFRKIAREANSLLKMELINAMKDFLHSKYNGSSMPVTHNLFEEGDEIEDYLEWSIFEREMGNEWEYYSVVVGIGFDENGVFEIYFQSYDPEAGDEHPNGEITTITENDLLSLTILEAIYDYLD